MYQSRIPDLVSQLVKRFGGLNSVIKNYNSFQQVSFNCIEVLRRLCGQVKTASNILSTVSVIPWLTSSTTINDANRGSNESKNDDTT